MTANMVLEFTHGKMVANTKATGTMGNSTAKEFIGNPMELNAVASGKKVKEWLGSMSSENSNRLLTI